MLLNELQQAALIMHDIVLAQEILALTGGHFGLASSHF